MQSSEICKAGRVERFSGEYREVVLGPEVTMEACQKVSSAQTNHVPNAIPVHFLVFVILHQIAALQ